MKKINLTLLTGIFSICAIGLMAQNVISQKHSKIHQVKAISSKRLIKNENGGTTQKPMTTATASMQYPMTDMSLQSSYSLSSGWYTEPINRTWTVADTGTTNYDLSHSATVAFDTIIDYYTSKPYSAASGSLSVDTITSVVAYKNTSGTNDTVVFFIRNVFANGYPDTTSFLKADTIILNKGGFLPGNVLDSLYQISVLPKFTIPSGSRFAVTLQYSGAKVDTFDFCFGFPNAACSSSAGSAYANTFTLIGPKFGPTPACNSFVTGWEYYEFPTYFSETWPNINGNQEGSFKGSSPFDNDEWNLCGVDTEYFYWQDNAIYASVSFTDVTGIGTISPNGLSVSQNAPNPYNQSTQINYNIAKQSDIVFTVYDVTGRKMMNNEYSEVAPGKHIIRLDASQFGPGIFFYTFNINGIIETKKMVISE